MSQESLETMIMQNFWGVTEGYYGIVQVVNRDKLYSIQQVAQERIQDCSMMCPLRNDFNFVSCVCLLAFF